MSERQKERFHFIMSPHNFYGMHPHDIILHEKNGLFVLGFYHALLCESSTHGGHLFFDDESTPFTIEQLARKYLISVEDVTYFIGILEKYKLVVRQENGDIVMLKFKEFVTSKTRGALEKAAAKDERRRTETKISSRGKKSSSRIIEYKNIDIKNTPTIVGVEESGLAPAAVAETVFEGSHVGESTFAEPAAQNAGRVPTTREEVAAYIRFVNEKCNTKVSETEERDFWDFIVMRNSDPTKRVVTKYSIGRTLHAFLEIRHRQAQKDEREAAERRRNEIGHLVTSNEIQQNIASMHQETDEEFEARLEAQRKADAEELRIVREKLARGALDEL